MGIAATIATLTALAVPGVARAQTAGGTIDNGTLHVVLDGLGGLQVTYLDEPQLFDNSENGFALRSGDTTSYAGSDDRTNATTSVDGTTAVSEFHVNSLNVDVRETDALTAARDLTRTFTVTNNGTSPLDVRAGELADALIGGSDAGRGIRPPVGPPMVAGLAPDGQLSGLVQSANYPWAHWQEGPYFKVFDDFQSASSLRDAVDPNLTDNGFGAEWDTTLAPQGQWTIQVIWRFDASMRVNSTDDTFDETCDATNCSLRDAVESAPSGAVITLPAGTFALDRHSELSIVDRSLSIYGAGAMAGEGTIIDGEGLTRLFEVADGADVTLSGLRLQGGNGAVVTYAPRRARADLQNGSGGALLLQEGGALTLMDSEVAQNAAALQGGGIAGAGTLTLLRSTVAENTAGTSDGAGQGGGLYLTGPGATSVLDSTVGDNTVYGNGAGIATTGPLTLLSSTIAGNRIAGGAAPGAASGVLAGSAAVTAHDSIVAGGAPVCAGGGYTSDYDIVSDGSCNLTGTHDRQGVDPGLGTLTYNLSQNGDVPQTRTFAPHGNSQAVDSGDNQACTDPLLEGMDQLGQPRIQHLACDVGAVEIGIAAPVINSPVNGSSVGSPITFRGTVQPNDQVFVVSDAEADVAPVQSDADGNWTLQYGPVDSGTYTFVAYAVDPDSGAVSFPSDSLQLTVNGPAAPQISATPVTGSTVTLSGTAAPGDAISILEGDSQVGSATADQNGNWTAVLSNVSPGSHTYTAVAKDAAGTPSPPSSPRTVTVASTQQATPTPTPTATAAPTPTATPLPPPVKGKTVNAQTKSGSIKIKLPGTNRFVTLGPGQQIPTGTTVDTTHGRITLTAAGGKRGHTQHADFYKGIFKVTQSRGRKPVTQLALAGPKPTCTTKRTHKHKAHAAAARKHKKKRVKTRKLWGSGHGSFRTKGRYSSATVRGTTWLTQDSCAGTLTRVTHGVVQVRDFRRHKKILVRAHHRYLARAKRR